MGENLLVRLTSKEQSGRSKNGDLALGLSNYFERKDAPMKLTSPKLIARVISPRKALNAISLVLVFCIADINVIADNRVTHSKIARNFATKPNADHRVTATNDSPGKLPLGRLVVPYHKEILVNGHSAMSGDIILSGSHVQTRNAADAVKVEIDSIANLEIEPNTDLSLTFDQKSVEVKVAAGNATLSTSDGVKGEVVMSDGEVCASVPCPDPQCKKPPYKRPEIIVPVLVAGVLIPVLIYADRQKCIAVASPIIPCEVIP